VGALGWVRDVIADHGDVAPIPVRVEEGAGGCFLVAGVNGGAARIAVDRRRNPAPHPILKEIHSCEVAGRRLEAESPEALRRKVAAMLEGLAPGRDLPLAYFRAPAAGYELPVYADEDHIVAHAFGGPRSRARDLAGVRAHVARHLVSAGYVAAEDDLEVALVDPVDLCLIEPTAAFRSLADEELWLPWIDRSHAADPRIDRLGLDASGDADVLAVLAWLRDQASGQWTVDSAEFLYASGVRPAAWSTAQRGCSDAGMLVLAEIDGDAPRLELPVLRTATGELVVALDCGGIDVFLGATPHELATLIGMRLVRHGCVPSPDRVAVGTR
jgi:hypothetical protein